MRNKYQGITEMIEQIKLLELMSARMFHDLAGPIGAVNNSLEFFEEENPNIREKALEIVKSSSAESILRLKFFRQAYGPANDSEIAINDIKPIVQDFLKLTKVTLTWNSSDLGMINSYAAKTILNFIIIALGTMIHGGNLGITKTNKELKINFNGKNMIFPDETKMLLNGELSHITLSSANIQLYYTHMAINSAKHKLQINQTTDNIEFILK